MTFLQTSLLSNSKKQIYFLFLVVLVLYCPAISGTINSIDDAGIMKFYSDSHLSLLDIVRPGPGYYYRPITALSYYLDYNLFGQNTYLMHLENILIHAVNAVLLFLLASRLVPLAARGLPLAAALVFATHPANTEAVSWIAGRTDPLAALFILLSAISLCKGLESGRVRHTVLAVILFLAGGLAKETALVFIPASFLLVQGWQQLHPGVSAESVKLQRKVLCLLYLAIGLLLAIVFVYRTGSHCNSMEKLLTGNKLDAAGSLLFCLKIVGFYLKKMVVPWPLNFAITAVSGWYLVPAAAAAVLLWFAPKKNPYFFLVPIGLLFLLPAVVVALFDVAWTMVAERYLYIPSAFLCLGLTGYLYLAADRMRLQRLLFPFLSLCIVAAAVSSLQRTLIWRSNLALYQDTVAKTPEFGMLRNELAVALVHEGRLAEAEEQLNIASSLDVSSMVKGLIRGNRILIKIKGASPAETRRILNTSGLEKSQEETQLLAILRRNDYLILNSLPAGAQKEALVSELIELSEILYARTRDPLLLYNNGQLYVDRGDRKSAATCFVRSYLAAPDGAHYKIPAKKLAQRLGGQRL